MDKGRNQTEKTANDFLKKEKSRRKTSRQDKNTDPFQYVPRILR
jgi:hypothetical protein